VRYLGLDVHSGATVWCLLDEAGETAGRGKVATTAPALTALVKRLSTEDELLVGQEVGTMSYFVHDIMTAAGMKLLSFDARMLRMIASSRKKTDRRDAFWIAKAIQTGMTPHPVYIPSGEVRRVRQLLNQRDGLRRDQKRWLVRAKSAVRAAGLSTPASRSPAALLDKLSDRPDGLDGELAPFADAAPRTHDAEGTDDVAEDEGDAPDDAGVVAAEPPNRATSHAAGDTPPETVDDVLAELDALVGLASVKDAVRNVMAVVQANQERERAGLAAVNPGLHLVFTGSPGTGKTTVARLIARLYAASGALPGSDFAEVDRSDLVAGYVGQTAIKTAKVVTETIPGVLFIDEAYALTPGHRTDYGGEAIATLVKAMEDHRHELALIVAGYADEMAAFVDSNPGLRSRLETFIHFPDYTPAELLRIFRGFARAAGLGLAEGAVERAEALFRRAVDRPGFGNGRFARTLFEQAYARMARRAAEDGEVRIDELTEIAADDLAWLDPQVERSRTRIGFGEGEV